MAEQRYQILEPLGEGGSGSVFLAMDTVLQRKVAIKRLLTTEGAVRTDDEITSIKREAATMAQLRHENIVTTFDIAQDEKGLFIVMELVEGRDLEAWLKFQPLVWNDFAQVVTQTLDAMLAAHRKNILHLDLKPQNIRVQRLPDGRLKTSILDFGLAQLATGPQKQRLSEDGRLFGTVHYMAPEQFRLEELDTRTDLYALGCIYYECLTGKAPFEGETSVAVRDAHLAHAIIPLQQKRPDLPPQLCEWVMWLIMPDRANRPNDAGVALQSFQNLCYQIASWSSHHEATPVSLVQPVEIIPETEPATAAPLRTSSVPSRTSTVPSRTSSVPNRTSSVPMSTGGSQTSALRGPARLPGTMVQKPAVNKAVFVGVGAVVLVVAALLILRPGKPPTEGTPPTTQTNTPPAKKPAPKPISSGIKTRTPASLPLPNAVVGRFVSDQQVMTFDDANTPSLGKATTPARVAQPVAAWKDITSKNGYWQMVQTGRLIDSAPRFASVEAPGLHSPMMALRFDGKQGFRMTSSFKWRPGSLTVALVFRPRFVDPKTEKSRVFDLHEGDGQGRAVFSLLVSKEDGDTVRVGATLGHGAKYASTSAKRPSEDVPLIVVAALDLETSEVRLRLRSTAGWDETGKIARIAGRPPPPYSRIALGPSVKPDGTTAPDGFAGDVFEVVIYDTPLQFTQMGELLDSLATHYFVY
ncbi:MAG: serine/threonine-protein kinase [Prosthecobacter sp.]